MDLSLQFLVDLDAGFESQRGELREEKVGKRRIQTGSKETLAVFVLTSFNTLFLTEIFRVEALA